MATPRAALPRPTPPGPEGSKGKRALAGVRGVPVVSRRLTPCPSAMCEPYVAGVREGGPVSLALYRKYRPGTFAEVVGQEHVTEPLQQALRSGRIHHAYLFSGPRGCGKTSSARILARSLNCEKGPTPTPCGVC